VQIAKQVKDYLKDGVIQNAVNVPSVSHDEYLKLQPYGLRSGRGGLAQVSDGRLQEISLRHSGDIAEWKTELIRNAGVKGIPNQHLKKPTSECRSHADSCGLRPTEERKRRLRRGADNVLTIQLTTNQRNML
jgi:D-3-phosphoglycerate dehydrogenase